MNHREPPLLPAGARRALRYLSLLLLPALAPKSAHSLPHSRPVPGAPANLGGDEPAPYLPLLGALPLRFQSAPPPPDLTTRPAAAAPPVPAPSPTESSVAQANAAAVQPAAATKRVADETPLADLKPRETPPPAKPVPPPILPDDARQAIRPEDFLPYFQIPGSAKQPGDVNVIVPAALAAPAPAPLPPSSVIYTQTPK